MWWLIVGAVITLLCDKAFNKIIPDNPIFVNEITDSVRIIHTYDFDVKDDSVVNAQLKMKLENIALAQTYELKIDELKSQHKSDFNGIMLNSSFLMQKVISLIVECHSLWHLSHLFKKSSLI